jgi:1,4-alpha-glucan branching enzyme
MFAEDSTTFPHLTAPVHEGGIGFDYKWNMGWMNDTLKYFSKDPIYRKYHHDLLTFGLVYAYSERFILPLSHDEVVHGKGSLVDKMPGDYWQKFANFRLLIGLLFTHPGKKLLFMGGEFAQMHEWKDKEELDWLLLNFPMHSQVNHFVKDIIKVYNFHKPLFELDHHPQGFSWIDQNNYDQSVISFIRRAHNDEDLLVIILNMTPVSYGSFVLGVPYPGLYEEVLNSDKEIYGGSGQYNGAGLESFAKDIHNQSNAVELILGPLAISILKYQKPRG